MIRFGSAEGIAEVLRGVDLLRDPRGRRMCIEFSEEEIGETILGAEVDAADGASDDAVLDLVDQLLSRDVAMWDSHIRLPIFTAPVRSRSLCVWWSPRIWPNPCSAATAPPPPPAVQQPRGAGRPTIVPV